LNLPPLGGKIGGMTKSTFADAAEMPPAGGLSPMNLAEIPNPGRPRKLGDGKGLFLLVNPDGSRYWRVKYTFAGKPKMLSLGVYPKVDLTEARQLATRIRAQAAAGLDPSQARRDAKAKARTRALEAAAEAREPAAFLLSAAGSLMVDLPGRSFMLNPDETRDLRSFLAATSSVGAPCHGN
jgi:hypothetical protein